MDLNILNITNYNILIIHVILFLYIYNVLWYILVHVKLENKLKISLIYYLLKNMKKIKSEWLKMYETFYFMNFLLNLLFIRHKIRYCHFVN
jgi:hypothetical protein